MCSIELSEEYSIDARLFRSGLTKLSLNPARMCFAVSRQRPAAFAFRKDGPLTEGDPTDHALATIASILDQPASPPEAAKANVSETQESPAPQETGIDGYS